MKTSHEPCHFFPPDLWSLTKYVCNTKSNKNSGFNLLSLFHHKLTITFCNNVSSIKREVRGKDSYVLELLSLAADRGCLAAGMDFSVIVPVFARSTKTVKHILLSHQLKLDLSSTDIKAKVLLLSVVLWWGRSGLQKKKVILSSERFVTLQSSTCLWCQ